MFLCWPDLSGIAITLLTEKGDGHCAGRPRVCPRCKVLLYFLLMPVEGCDLWLRHSLEIISFVSFKILIIPVDVVVYVSSLHPCDHPTNRKGRWSLCWPFACMSTL